MSSSKYQIETFTCENCDETFYSERAYNGHKGAHESHD